MSWVVRIASFLALLLVALVSGAGVMGCESVTTSEWTDASKHVVDNTISARTLDDSPDEEQGAPDALLPTLTVGAKTFDLMAVKTSAGGTREAIGPREGVCRERERPPESV